MNRKRKLISQGCDPDEPAWKKKYKEMAASSAVRLQSETTSSTSFGHKTPIPAQDAVRAPSVLPRNPLPSSVPSTQKHGITTVKEVRPCPPEVAAFFNNRALIKNNQQQKGAVQPASRSNVPLSMNQSGATAPASLNKVEKKQPFSLKPFSSSEPPKKERSSLCIDHQLQPGDQSKPAPEAFAGTFRSKDYRSMNQHGAAAPPVSNKEKDFPSSSHKFEKNSSSLKHTLGDEPGATTTAHWNEKKKEPSYSHDKKVPKKPVPSTLVENHGTHQKSNEKSEEHRRSESTPTCRSASRKTDRSQVTSTKEETKKSTGTEKNSDRNSRSSEMKTSGQKSSDQSHSRKSPAPSSGRATKPQGTSSQQSSSTRPEKRRSKSPRSSYEDREPKKSSESSVPHGSKSSSSENDSARQRSDDRSKTSRSQLDSTSSKSTKSSSSSYRKEAATHQSSSSSSSNDHHARSSSQRNSNEKHFSSSRTKERDGRSSHSRNDSKAEVRSTSSNRSVEKSKNSESKHQSRRDDDKVHKSSKTYVEKGSRRSEKDNMTDNPDYQKLATSRAADATRVLSRYQRQVSGEVSEVVQPKASWKLKSERRSLESSGSSSQEEGPTPPTILTGNGGSGNSVEPKKQNIEVSLSPKCNVMEIKKEPVLTEKDTQVKSDKDYEEKVQTVIKEEEVELVAEVKKPKTRELEPATKNIEGFSQPSDGVPQNWMKSQEELPKHVPQLAEQSAGISSPTEEYDSAAAETNDAHLFKRPLLPEEGHQKRRHSENSVATQTHPEEDNSGTEEALVSIETQELSDDAKEGQEQEDPSPSVETSTENTPSVAVQPPPQPETSDVMPDDVPSTAQELQILITPVAPAIVPTKMASIVKLEDIIASESNSWKIQPSIRQTDTTKPTIINVKDPKLGLLTSPICSYQLF